MVLTCSRIFSISETTPTELTQRAGLPDTLRVLYETYPREFWPEHDHFHGLVSFWLDRHLMFRKLLGFLRGDTEARIDGALDDATYLPRLQRFGSMFLSQLHGHHQIEDMQYFPRLLQLEARLETGFTLLDADHHTLDASLNELADAANATLAGREAGRLRDDLLRFEGFLDRHLVDEEELIVPIILKHGPDRIEG